MRTLPLLAALALLQGCASMPRDIVAEESTLQALRIVDIVQTADIRKHPGESEIMSDAFIGHHPSSASAWQFGPVESLGHLVVTDYLVSKGHPDLARIWEGITIGFQTKVIIDNATWHNHEASEPAPPHHGGGIALHFGGNLY